MIVSHKLLSVLFGIALIGLVALTLLAWRLAQGPLALDFMTARIEAALNADNATTRVKIGGIDLAWEGFNHGLDRPVDLHLRGIAVVDAAGRKLLEVPRAAMTISVSGLLIGRVVPRAVELDGVRLTVTRGTDDKIGIDVGDLTETNDTPQPDGMRFDPALAELMQPTGGDWLLGGHMFTQLRHVRLTDIGIRIVDRKLGVTWRVPKADLDLVRRGGGGIDLTGEAAIELGDQRARLTLTATSSPDRETMRTRFTLSPIMLNALAGFEALNAPISAQGEVQLSGALVPRAGTLTLKAGAGSLRVRSGSVPVRSASVAVSGTVDDLKVDAATLVLPGLDNGLDSTFSLAGAVRLGTQRVTARLSLGLDRIGLADLPRLWPTGLGGGARSWITENMTDGTAHDGRVDIALEANRDFSGLTMTNVTGAIEAENLTVHWFRPVPPAEQGRAKIRIVDADTIDIAILAGRQRVGAKTPIVLTGGNMRITGMSMQDQVSDITVQVTTPLADAIALLKEPRLKLLSTHPMDLKEPSGDGTVAVKVKLPLESWLAIDDVDIEVAARIRQGHLSGVAAGRDLDQAELEIAASKSQMTLKGQGLLGGIASKIDGLMDFRASRPKDVQQRIAVNGKPNVRQLAAAGLDLGETLTGDIPLSAVWSKQVGGDGDIVLEADLTEAAALVSPLAWRKASGVAAKASARLRLGKDRLSGIDGITADGVGVSLRGAAEVTGGRVSGVRLDRVVLGNTDVSGTIRLPPDGPIGMVLQGPSLDVAAKVAEKTRRRDRSEPEPVGPAWTLSGNFGRVLLANGTTALNVQVEAANDGLLFRRLNVAGATGPSALFAIGIAMDGGVRRMTAGAADAGAFLRGLDAIHTFQGGVLTLAGAFDDTNAIHALSGTAEVTDFRVRGAPALGKLLQAMTLYGLVDVVQGPGLGFSRLTAPFVVSGGDLELKEARAFSPSLGMTAKGHLDMAADTVNMEGTIVPAYFFNSLLGRIPFFGGLFKTEEGGGLFAANYTLRGPVSDPTVFVNPLSMLTPGFLRRIFGIF